MKDELKTLAELIGYLTAILGALVIGVRLCIIKPFRLIKRTWESYRGQQTLQPLLSELLQAFPSGSSSLPATVERILDKTAFNRAACYAIANATGLSYFEANAEGVYIYVSDHWCEMFSVSSRTALGNGWRIGIAEHDRDRVNKEWAAMLLDERESSIEFDTHSGKYVSCRVIPCRDISDGQVLGYIGIVSPVEIKEMAMPPEQKKPEGQSDPKA